MRPSRDVTSMAVAIAMSRRTTCNKNSGVGVVIERDGRIVATGYNGAPAGMPHCMHFCDCGEEIHTLDCAMKVPCENAVHAECNAIAFAARYMGGCNGATLFTTFSPCLSCAQLTINAGIVRVVYGTEFRDKRGLELLRNAGVNIICIPVQDAIAFA